MFKAEIIGNLGADAEVRESNGSKFVTFRVAHSEKWSQQDGTQRERTQWIDVIMSNADSKVIPYLKQGVKVFVRGHASLRTYSSPKERMILAGCQINALEIELCGGIADDVPREVINPSTSEIMPVTRLYWTQAAPKGMKKDEVLEVIDKKGNIYLVDKNGFIQPKVEEQQKQGE